MTKILLLRSPSELIEKNQAGYGWRVNFSEFTDIKLLLEKVKEEYGSLGRSKNQITTFFDLKQGDILVIPLGSNIVLATVEGKKSFELGIRHGSNRISVKYFRDDNGKIIKIPRSVLKQNLESRLRLRTTIGDLSKFAQEINSLIEGIENRSGFSVEEKFKVHVEQTISDFKSNLLNAICKGHTRIEAGGKGLEELVKELLIIEGYSNVDILGKKNGKGIADVDIQATSNNPFLKDVLVQVKHHTGETGAKAIKQLIAYEVETEAEAYKWVITSGTIEEKLKIYAKEYEINIMEGIELVDWIYANLSKLSDKTKASLGVVDVPSLSW